MASAQIPSLVRLYKVAPNGNKTLLFQNRVEQLAPAGGASEGAPASVSTPEKLLSVISNVKLYTNDILAVSIQTDSAKTSTYTKCIWSIPLVTAMGAKTLGRAQFADGALASTAYVAGQETFVAGYKIVEGEAMLQGKIYLDFQDNA